MTAVRPRFGLPAALLRHGLVVVLAAGAVLAQGALSVSVSERPWSWLAVAIGVGALGAIIARRLIGAVFLVAGFVVGIELLLVGQSGSTAAVATTLATDGWLYAAMIAASLEAYLVVLLMLVVAKRA